MHPTLVCSPSVGVLLLKQKLNYPSLALNYPMASSDTRNEVWIPLWFTVLPYLALIEFYFRSLFSLSAALQLRWPPCCSSGLPNIYTCSTNTYKMSFIHLNVDFFPLLKAKTNDRLLQKHWLPEFLILIFKRQTARICKMAKISFTTSDFLVILVHIINLS